MGIHNLGSEEEGGYNDGLVFYCKHSRDGGN